MANCPERWPRHHRTPCRCRPSACGGGRTCSSATVVGSSSTQQSALSMGAASSSSGAGSHWQWWVSRVVPQSRWIVPAHATRGFGMPAVVARDCGGERGATAWPCAGRERTQGARRTLEIKFSATGDQMHGAWRGRERRFVGGSGGDPAPFRIPWALARLLAAAARRSEPVAAPSPAAAPRPARIRII